MTCWIATLLFPAFLAWGGSQDQDQDQPDHFGDSPEGALVLALEKALLAHPSLTAKVTIQEKQGARVVGEKLYDVKVERPLKFRLEMRAAGKDAVLETAVSDGQFVLHTAAGDRHFQSQPATPFSVCGYLPPVIAFASLARPSDWYRSQEGLLLQKPTADVDLLSVDVSGVPGTLSLSRATHLPQQLEVSVTAEDGSKSQFEAKVASLEQGERMPRSTFLFDVPKGAVEDAAEGEGLDAVLLPVGSPAPAFSALDAEGLARDVAGSAGKPRVIVFWFAGGASSEAQADAVLALAAQGRADVIAVHCGDPGGAAKERAARAAGGTSWLQDGEDDKAASRVYRVAAYPTTYVIGADGKIVDRFLGADRDRAQNALRRP
jgi:outer membrane lipoprotein-sorting protein